MSEIDLPGADEFQRKHDDLGHRLGWRFLASSVATVGLSPIRVMTLNPGGHAWEPPIYSCEDGSAYRLESWKGRPPGQESLQQQMKLLAKLASLQLDDFCIAHLVPFRSRNWASLVAPQESVEFGAKIWRTIFSLSPARLTICIGQSTADFVKLYFGYTPIQRFRLDWGKIHGTVLRTQNGAEVLVLPHLSRFRVLGRSVSVDDQISSIIARARDV
jgi:hypothetical protein